MDYTEGGFDTARARPNRTRAAGRTTVTARPLAWATALVAVAIVGLLALTVLRPSNNAGPLSSLNRPAYDFTLALYNGRTLHLHDLRGKTVVVNFWWSNCAPCIQEASLLEQQWHAWKHKGVVFVGVDENDTPASALVYLKKFAVSYPNGPDPGDVDIQYGTTGQPETYFVSPRGILRAKYVQPFTDAATLNTLIKEARV